MALQAFFLTIFTIFSNGIQAKSVSRTDY